MEGNKMKRLTNRVALVTSSTRGIGLACAKRPAAEGALVYLAARSEEAALNVIRSVQEDGGRAKFVYFNAREPETYSAMIEAAVQNEGRLDILVNNYGGTDVRLDHNVTEGDTETFFRVLEDNVRSVYLSAKAAIPHMEKGGGGSIVNISSVGSVVPDLSRTAYAVSKTAVNALTQCIAVQYAHRKIRCNAVLPGLTATRAALDNMSDSFRSSFLKHVPLGRIAAPEDIAAAAAFFAGDDASYITGTLLEVAGGFALPTPMYGDLMEGRFPNYL